MKKITLLMLFLSTLWGYSQVKRYTFAKSVGTYQEITDGTILGSEANDAERFVDPTIPVGSTAVPGVTTGFTGVGLPIGFSFTFNSYVYDKFAVSTDGFISLGTSVGGAGVDINVQTVNSPISSNVPANDILSAKIAGLAKDLRAQTGSILSYKTIGDVVGQRVLVVQWKKYMKGTTIGTGDNFNFQIRLNEGTNNIQVVYGSMVSNAQATAQTFAVGLRASSLATNFVNRTSTTGWDNTADGTTNIDKVLMSDIIYPSNGLTYTWSLPTCGGAIAAVSSNITTSGATLNFSAYTPTPDSYEYIASTSATLPLAAVSGTASNGSSATASGLNPTTLYNVFMRTKCGSEYTPWILGGTFKTLCLDALTFYEDFDSYATNTLPDCWDKVVVGSGTAAITGSTVSPMSAPNRLSMTGNSGTSISYAIMPVISNFLAGTNRLKFKAYASGAITSGFDVGYFDGINNTGTFHSLQVISLTATTNATAQEIIVPPFAITAPGVKNLVFRNAGNATSSLTVNIDNVVWETNPASTCPDVTALTGKGITSSSIDLTWTKGGTEAQWQYACGPGLQNPNAVKPVDVSSNAVTVPGLSASTNYKLWVRSKRSDTELGAWIGPLVFSTTCAPVTQFMENFDSSTSLPSCWAKVGTTGTIGVSANILAPTQPNQLVITSSSTTNIGMVTLPPVSNYGDGSNRLRFKIRGSAAGVSMDIGYLTDVNDPASYTFLQTVASTEFATTTFTELKKNLGTAPLSPYLVFKSTGTVYGSIILDDVAWEPNPTCPDITGFALSTVRGTSADLTWTAGGNENTWQYALGGLTTTNPYSLSAVDVPSTSTPLSLTIGGLTPVTYYKVWIRSKCAGGIYGSWMGPVGFTTSCASGTDFTQNFDVTQTTMPACWTKVGLTGSIATTTTGGATSGTYALSLGTSSTAPAICAMPPVSNAGAGTYTLKFQYKSSVVNGVLEVGYLINPSDPTSFSAIKSYTATQNTSYVPISVELGTDATTDVLAFRNAGVPSCTIYIDDVIWSPTPTCVDVKNLVATGATGTSISVDWDAGGSETKWEYAIGSASLADPSKLTPVEVLTTSSVTIAGLNPVSSYKVWVHSKCSTYSKGAWIGPILVTTTCAGVDSFTQNFDNSTVMPSCWNNVGSKVAALAIPLDDALGGTKALVFAGTGQTIVSMPPLSNAGTGDHVLKFKYKANKLGCVIEVGYLANPTDENSFVSFSSTTIDNTDVFKTKVLALGSSPVSSVLAFRCTVPFRSNVFVDDVSWELAPTAVPACATGVTATPNANCGKLATVISWDAVSGADGYLVDVALAPNGPYVLTNQDAGAGLSYSFLGKNNTTYYYTVKPYNSIGTATGCKQLSFVTNATDCYCISNPINNDFEGIMNVQLATANFTNPDVTYNDFTSKSTNINIAPGGKTNLKITFGQQIDYNTAVCIDFNNDFYFDESEVVSGVPSGGATPSLVDASFTIPTTAASGMHRMRIVTWSGTFSSYSPCYNFPYGVTLDFNVNVVVPVVNDDPAGAVTLVVGSDFAQNAQTGTNINATATTTENEPGWSCGNYSGSDVWYKAVVPASGNLTFEVNTVSGGITNTAAATYSGVIGSLTLIGCNDPSSVPGQGNNGNQPKISLTGRKPGEVLYFRVWENGGDAFGAFKVSAYDAVASILGVNTFDSINFSYYPNPVKDILNLSFNQEMSSVSIVNLLGQQVIFKSLNANQGKIDMTGLSKGTYLVKVTVGNQSKTIKVIKE